MSTARSTLLAFVGYCLLQVGSGNSNSNTQQQITSIHLALPPEREEGGRSFKEEARRSLCIFNSNERSANASSSSWTCGNWAGTNTWKPSTVFMPQDEAELASFLQQASTSSPPTPVKVVGFGHSWSRLYIPAKASNGQQGSTIVLHHLSGINKLMSSIHDDDEDNDMMEDDEQRTAAVDEVLKQGSGYVEVMAGTSFANLHHELNQLGLNLAWQSGGIQGLTVCMYVYIH